jgi:hypothetical protein
VVLVAQRHEVKGLGLAVGQQVCFAPRCICVSRGLGLRFCHNSEQKAQRTNNQEQIEFFHIYKLLKKSRKKQLTTPIWSL